MTQEDKRIALQKIAQSESQRDWRYAEWLEAENEPFAKIRREIDDRLRHGGSAHKMVKEFALDESDRYDALKQFRWAYAAYRSQYASPDDRTMMDIARVMDTNLRPGVYEWARLRYLVEADRIWFDDSGMVELGRRLIHHDPQDREVRYPFARVLSGSDDLKDRLQALAMARNEVRRQPRSVRWQSLVAGASDSIWLRTRKPEYARAARDGYLKCLTLLPPGHPYRRNMIRGAVWFQNYCNPDGTRRKGATHEQYVQALKTTKLR